MTFHVFFTVKTDHMNMESILKKEKKQKYKEIKDRQ